MSILKKKKSKNTGITPKKISPVLTSNKHLCVITLAYVTKNNQFFSYKCIEVFTAHKSE